MSLEDNPVDDRYQLNQCIDEIKSLQSQIATLTAERDEALSKLTALEVAVRNLTDTIAEMETRKEADKSNAAMSDRCNRVLRDSGNADAESAFWIIAGDARESRAHNLRITAELAALKSAPAMAEVRSILLRLHHDDSQEGFYEWGAKCKRAAKEAVEFATSAIASREEVVGLLRWCWMMFDSSIVDLAADQGDEEGISEARRIIEIVEGK